MINPVGVTTKKNIIAIIIGEIYLPRIIPNLNQILFKGPSNLEFSKPNIKKIKEAKIAQILISLPLSRGQKAISTKTIANTIPKLLLEPIFKSLLLNLDN